jgi:four helix bundle protein
MAKITRFEDLESWQKARKLSQDIYTASSAGSFAKDYSLKEQISRATGSIMDNIAEGFGRSGRKEFVNFLIIARGSGSEVKSQPYRALDRKHLEQTIFNQLYDDADHINRMISRLVEHLQQSEFDGLRYKKPEN